MKELGFGSVVMFSGSVDKDNLEFGYSPSLDLFLEGKEDGAVIGKGTSKGTGADTDDCWIVAFSQDNPPMAFTDTELKVIGKEEYPQARLSNSGLMIALVVGGLILGEE